MKKFILILLLIAAGGYFYSPYKSTGAYRDGLNNGEDAAIDKVVDWAAVRASVKDQVLPLVSAPLRLKWKDAGMDEVLAETISSKALIDRYRTEGDADGKVKKVEFSSRSFSGMTTFKTSTSDGDELIFKMAGFSGWMLVSMKFKETTAANMAKAWEEKITANLTVGTAQEVKKKKEKVQQNQWILKGYKNPLDKNPERTKSSR